MFIPNVQPNVPKRIQNQPEQKEKQKQARAERKKKRRADAEEWLRANGRQGILSDDARIKITRDIANDRTLFNESDDERLHGKSLVNIVVIVMVLNWSSA